MLRATFIALSESRSLRSFAEKTALGQRLSSRFVAGLTIEDALRAARAMNQMGLGVSVDNLIDFDFAARLKKVVDKVESVGEKAGWCIHDAQFINVLVKNDAKGG